MPKNPSYHKNLHIKRLKFNLDLSNNNILDSSNTNLSLNHYFPPLQNCNMVNFNNIKFTNLKKTTKKISLTIPLDLFEKIKVRANKFDIPYQSLIKMYIFKAYNEYLQK